MKLKLKGCCFNTLDKIQIELQAVLDIPQKETFHNALEVWRRCWDGYVCSHGGCFEGDHNQIYWVFFFSFRTSLGTFCAPSRILVIWRLTVELVPFQLEKHVTVDLPTPVPTGWLYKRLKDKHVDNNLCMKKELRADPEESGNESFRQNSERKKKFKIENQKAVFFFFLPWT